MAFPGRGGDSLLASPGFWSDADWSSSTTQFASELLTSGRFAQLSGLTGFCTWGQLFG